MSENSHLNEAEEVAAVKKGDTRAFDALFLKYGKRLYHFSFGYLKSKYEAEEVVQNVFFKIWKNRDRLNPSLSFNAYLFKITYREILEKLRKLIQEQKRLNELASETLHFSSEMDEQLNYKSMLDLVNSCLQKLPDRQREIIYLRKIQGLSIKTIAEQLQISPKTVGNHITEAMKNIKAILEKGRPSGMFFYIMFWDKKDDF